MITRHNAICDYFQLDPAHYAHTQIEALEEETTFGCYRITWLNDSVQDFNITFDEDGVALDAYMYNQVN